MTQLDGLLEQPLSDVTVIEFGHFVAGPGTALVLADLGATVVKIEPFSGDAARSAGSFGRAMFAAFNRGKRSVVIDISRSQGSAIARRLCTTADVVIQNLRIGALERARLDPASLCEENPSLIHASVSGFGSAGHDANRPAFDIVAQAESGMLSVIGEPGGKPIKVSFPLVDTATTHILASSILGALRRRDRTGQGARLEVSLLDVAFHLQSQLWAEYLNGGEMPRQTGYDHPTAAPAGDLVEVADGSVVVSAYTEAHWERLCTALGRPSLAADSRFVTTTQRVRNRGALRQVLEHELGELTRRECVRLLSEAGVVVGGVLDFQEAARAREADAGDLFFTIDEDDHRLTCLRPPVIGHGWNTASTGPPPQLGEHTRAVLTDLGIDDDEVERLRADGVVLLAD